MTQRQRISAAKLQPLQRALSDVLACIADARKRYKDCETLSARHIAGTSRFLKDLLALPHGTDYGFRLEVQLKRRLVRLNHRVNGRHFEDAKNEYCLRQQLPAVYQVKLDAFDQKARVLMRSLAEVDVTQPQNRQPFMRVHELL